jgi:hypothetical protein
MIRRILLLALLISFNAHAQVSYPTNTIISETGDFTYALLDNPQLSNGLQVDLNSGGSQNFTDTFTFDVSQSEASQNYAAYGNYTGGTNISAWGLYTAGGALVQSGSFFHITGRPSSVIGALSTSPLAQGSYYYQFTGNFPSQGVGTNYILAYELAPYVAIVTPPPVPEPSTYALMLMGLVGIGYALRRRARVTPMVFA